MNKNEHKRVKHKQEPGDVPKQVKIAMREKKAPIKLSPYHTISAESAKKYRKMLAEKAKTVQRRRDRKAAEEYD